MKIFCTLFLLTVLGLGVILFPPIKVLVGMHINSHCYILGTYISLNLDDDYALRKSNIINQVITSEMTIRDIRKNIFLDGYEVTVKCSDGGGVYGWFDTEDKRILSAGVLTKLIVTFKTGDRLSHDLGGYSIRKVKLPDGKVIQLGKPAKQ